MEESQNELLVESQKKFWREARENLWRNTRRNFLRNFRKTKTLEEFPQKLSLPILNSPEENTNTVSKRWAVDKLRLIIERLRDHF